MLCNWHHPFDWSLPNGWSVVSQIAGTTQIKAPFNATKGTYQLKVRGFYNNRVNPYYSHRTFYISKRSVVVQGTPGVCGGNEYPYTAMPDASIYSRTCSGNRTKVSQTDYQIRLYTPSYSTPAGGVVQVTYSGYCGNSGPAGLTVYPNYSCGSYSYAVYPNPAYDELNVEQVAEQDTTSSANEKIAITPNEKLKQQKSFTVELYKEARKQASSGESKKGKLKLDTKNLPSGTYFLHINTQDRIIQKQIIINDK